MAGAEPIEEGECKKGNHYGWGDDGKRLFSIINK